MSKTLILVLVAASIISIAVAADVTCKDHPAFSKAKGLLTDAVKSDEKGKALGENLQKDFLSASPSTMTEEEMGVCKDYKGQKSCCSKKLIDLIDKAALLKVKPLQKAKNAFHKLISSYNNLLNKKCTKENVVAASVDQMFSNTALVEFTKAREAQKKCKIDFAKAITALNRGALCSICAGVEKVADYFNASGQLKISTASLTSFTTATDDAISCLAKTMTAASLDTIVGELNTAYIKNNDKCAGDILTKIKATFADPVKNDDGQKGKKCKGTTIFGDNSSCENALQGASDLEDKANTRLLRSELEDMERLLQVSTADAISDASGVNVYITSTSDSNIDEFGNINVAFEDSNNAIKLAFGALFALVALLI